MRTFKEVCKEVAVSDIGFSGNSGSRVSSINLLKIAATIYVAECKIEASKNNKRGA